MDTKQKQLETLSEIRSLMEQSSKFISLSGLSGVSTGIIALLGAAAAYIHIGSHLTVPMRYEYYDTAQRSWYELHSFLLLDAVLVLLLAITVGIFFTTRKAKKQGLPIWDMTAKRLVFNLALPIIVGGLFCLIMMYHHVSFLVAPATLVFYGLGLINAGKYTLNDIRRLGGMEILLGLIAALIPGYSLLFWALGFGVLHILYGMLMYFKYER